MGNAVTCGMDVERQQHAHRSARRRSTNRSPYDSCSSTSSPHRRASRTSSRGCAETRSRRSSNNVSPATPPKPLTSVSSVEAKEVKGGAGATALRRRSHRLSGTDIRSPTRRRNSPQQTHANPVTAHASDGAVSNDMSFSVPEIDSRPSSSGTMERFSAMAETYSFGSEAPGGTSDYAAEGQGDFDYHNDDADRVTPVQEFSLTKASPGIEAAPESVFAAWEMGFEIISGAHRVSPITSPTVHQKHSAAPDGKKAVPVLPSPTAKSTPNPTTTTLSEAIASLTGSEQTHRPTSAVHKVAKPACETQPTNAPKRMSAAMKEQPITSARAATVAIPPPPQPTPLLTAVQTTPTVPQQRRISFQPQLRAAPTTGRVKGKVDTTHLAKRRLAASYAARTSPQQLSKKASPPLQPAKAALCMSGHVEHFELYDLNFLNSAEPLPVSGAAQKPTTSPAAHTGRASPTSILSPSSPSRSSGHPPPTTNDGSPTGEARMNVSFSNFPTPVPLSLGPAKHTSTSPPVATAAAARGNAKGVAGGSSSGVAPSASTPFPKHPDSPAPGCSPSTSHTTTDGPRRRQTTDAPPTTCSSSPTTTAAAAAAAASSSVVNTTSSAPTKSHAPPATSGVGMSVSAAAAAAAAACARGEGEQRGDEGPTKAEGPGSPVMPRQRKASAHHRRRTHRRRNGKKEPKRHNNLYSEGDDDEENDAFYASGKDSASATDDDGSRLDELEESAPNLRASQKVDSILLRSGSFKSRGGGSVGPQDLTTATGSVSFLLCEKEAELAMASSQFMSKAVPRRRKERLRKMNEDFGMGVLSDGEGDAEKAATVGAAAPT